MNKITLIGNLTGDPDLRSTPAGLSVCSFTIAVNRKFVKQGEERKTDFFRITTWRQLAENCAKYLSKGKKVAAVGELNATLYEASNGETRISLDVTADEIEFLSSKSEAEPTKVETTATETQLTETQLEDYTSDDIPF